MPPPPYSLVPTGPIVPPTALAALLRLYQSGSGISAAAILSWSKAADSRVYAYNVQVKGPNDPSFVNVGTETSNTIEYQDVVQGVHVFRVQSIAMNGGISVWSETLTVDLTSDIPPSDVTGISLTFDPNGVAFHWAPKRI